MIQYRFDCGSGPGVARVDKVPVNDGYWHTVTVERIRQNVKVVVDGNHRAEGNAPGSNDVLNLDNNDVFFGAEVLIFSFSFLKSSYFLSFFILFFVNLCLLVNSNNGFKSVLASKDVIWDPK